MKRSDEKMTSEKMTPFSDRALVRDKKGGRGASRVNKGEALRLGVTGP